MNRPEGERLHADIHAGDVSGSGIVIGHGSSALVGATLPPAQREAIAMIDEFVRLLSSYEDSVPDASDIREAAEAVKAEVAEASPRWGTVRGVLRGIAASVAGLSALTDAIKNIQDLVAHFPR